MTPIVCANSDVERPLPKGVVWRDDPDAREGAPQHCLWWETGQTFVGTSEPAVCRDGSLAMPTPMAKRNASPLDTPRHRPTPLTRP